VQTEPNEITTNTASEVDFLLEDHGSIILLRPISAGAQDWVDTYIGEDNGYQPLWPTVTIEGRYLAVILDGIWEDGFVCTINGKFQ
jgi:hypothetical protein